MIWKWLCRKLELAGLDNTDRLRVQARYWQEDGYEWAEIRLLLMACTFDGFAEGALCEHEAWLRRWYREGLVERGMFREQILWLADQWSCLDYRQQIDIAWRDLTIQ